MDLPPVQEGGIDSYDIEISAEDSDWNEVDSAPIGGSRDDSGPSSSSAEEQLRSKTVPKRDGGLTRGSSEPLLSSSAVSVPRRHASEGLSPIKHEPKQRARKYKCPGCVHEKRFISRRDLNLHYRACHLGEKGYVCDHCPKKFAYPANLVLHKRKIHGVEPGELTPTPAAQESSQPSQPPLAFQPPELPPPRPPLRGRPSRTPSGSIRIARPLNSGRLEHSPPPFWVLTSILVTPPVAPQHVSQMTHQVTPRLTSQVLPLLVPHQVSSDSTQSSSPLAQTPYPGEATPGLTWFKPSLPSHAIYHPRSTTTTPIFQDRILPRLVSPC